MNEEIREEMVSLEIGEQVDLDHHPPIMIHMKDGDGGGRDKE